MVSVYSFPTMFRLFLLGVAADARFLSKEFKTPAQWGVKSCDTMQSKVVEKRDYRGDGQMLVVPYMNGYPLV